MHKISGIILAGGKSKRMGKDKAFLLFDGEPLIEVVMDKLLCLFEETIVVTGNPLLYARYQGKVKVKKDIIQGRGPLGGIYTALTYSSNEYNFVTACDTPLLNIDLLTYMVENARGYQAVVAEYEQKLHPLCALYAKSCLADIEERLSQHKLKMKDFLASINVRVIAEDEIKPFDPEGLSFTNINTYEDYCAHERKYQSH